MVKKIMIILSGFLVLTLLVFAYIIGKDFYNLSKSKEETITMTEEQKNTVQDEKHKAGDNRAESSGKLEKEELKKFADEKLNPFGDNLQGKDMNDSDFQEYIHGMSHQKIKAEEKWGFYELVPERVEWLLESLEDARGVEHKEEYHKILIKWKQNDFATIDVDHNVIWNMQGGTIGKATRVLTNEEEKTYLNSQE